MHPLEIFLRLAFLGVAGVLLLAAVWMTASNWNVIRTHEHARAEVVECERIGPAAGKGLNNYFVQVRYDGPNGPRTASVDRSNTNYEVGEIIDVYYMPETAYEVVAGDFMQMWFFVVVLGVTGSMVLFFAVKPTRRKEVDVPS